MEVKHYHSSSGRDLIEEFLQKCSQNIRNDYLDAIALLESGKVLAMPLSRNLFSICIGMHELRLKDSSGAHRFFYYVKKKDGIFVVHAFKKKKEELPPKEIDLALKRIKEI